MDPLSNILNQLRLTGSVFSRAELRSPFAVSTSGTDGAIFHIIVRGSGWVIMDGGEPSPFRSGDLMVLPHGDAHALSDDPQRRAVPIEQYGRTIGPDNLPTIEIDGCGPQTSILCGTFQVARDSLDYLLPLLPPLLHVHGGASNTAGWLDHTLRMMSTEVQSTRPGARVVLDRLADILAVQVLRSIVENPPAGVTGWLAALGDPMVARTLELIHADPARSWTADVLARDVGASRAVFFRRFSALVGEPPAAYLTRWRMQIARMALAREQLGVAEVAARVGYASEASFSRAFRRHTGTTPANFRKSVRLAS